MVKHAEAEQSFLKYLTDLEYDYKCAVGLILGQINNGKYYVIHLTKTPHFQSQEDKKTGRPLKALRNIAEVDETWIADHAHQAMKMLPGGISILGVFAVCDEELLTPLNAKVKSILSTIDKQLSRKYLSSFNNHEKLILHYSPKMQKYTAKSYDVSTLGVQPVDFKFTQKAARWVDLECSYQIDKIHYLKQEEPAHPLGQHIKVILDKIHQNLESSIILFDNDLKNKEDTLENIGAQKKVSKSSQNKIPENKPIQLTIFEQCVTDREEGVVEVIHTGGHIRVVGEVTCRLCLNAKASIEDASKAVVEDVMRSLATRLEMHYDSLTEEELSEDVNSVHEPPRRVLIRLPDDSMTVSDYLFPGEGPEDVRAALEELLDVKADNLEIMDIEGQADISQYYSGVVDVKAEEFLPKISSDTNRLVYLLGIVIAAAVLIISLLIRLYY